MRLIYDGWPAIQYRLLIRNHLFCGARSLRVLFARIEEEEDTVAPMKEKIERLSLLEEGKEDCARSVFFFS